MTERTFRIGEVAERAGVTQRTIRYYEELGLLAARDDRRKGAHRGYTEADVTRLCQLIRLRNLLGLSLEELAEVADAEEMRAALRDRWHDEPTDAERMRILDEAIAITSRQLDLAESRRAQLDEFLTEKRQHLRTLRRRRRELG